MYCRSRGPEQGHSASSSVRRGNVHPEQQHRDCGSWARRTTPSLKPDVGWGIRSKWLVSRQEPRNIPKSTFLFSPELTAKWAGRGQSRLLLGCSDEALQLHPEPCIWRRSAN